MEKTREFQPTRSRYLVITRDYLLPVLLIITAVLVWWIVFYTRLFSLTRIDCLQDFEPCENPYILTELQRYLGVNLLRFDSAVIKRRLTGADFSIRQVEVTKTLPGTLQVSLSSVYPTVAARLAGESKWVIFDDKLRVIGQKTKDPNVPTLITEELTGMTVGLPPADQALLSALDLTKRLSSSLSGIRSITLKGSDIILALNNNLTALMTTERDESAQITSLQLVLRDDTILSGVTTIDVRYSQPVLR